MKKCLNCKLVFFISIFVLLFTACSARKNYKSDYYEEIKTGRLFFRAANYEKSLEMFENLLNQYDNVTGDVYYYYGHSLSRVKNDEFVAVPYYKKAIRWFSEYKSEFPEDKNYDKAFYNMGVAYYKGDHKDLAKVKKIWDLGLSKNPDNKWIKNQYDVLKDQLAFARFLENYNAFFEEVGKAASVDEIYLISRKYKKSITEFPLKRVKKAVKIEGNYLRDLQKVVNDYDELVEEFVEAFKKSGTS